MTKRDFLAGLEKKLSELPKEDIKERLGFYSEMIDDRIEEGISEEEAVAEIMSSEKLDIESSDGLMPESQDALRESGSLQKKKRRLKAWEITLIAVGSPIWLSLGIAAFAVVISVYAVLFSVAISFWALFASLAASSVGGILVGFIISLNSNLLSGAATVGAAIACAGLAIFAFFMCKTVTKMTLIFVKKASLCIIKSFRRREESDEK